nr:hypothetical protein [Providencia heimbachae]
MAGLTARNVGRFDVHIHSPAVDSAARLPGTIADSCSEPRAHDRQRGTRFLCRDRSCSTPDGRSSL